eukprot:1471704-Lingulodinium_polyedra.AAC.1
MRKRRTVEKAKKACPRGRVGPQRIWPQSVSAGGKDSRNKGTPTPTRNRHVCGERPRSTARR